MFATEAEFRSEYDRLFIWRRLWSRLANAKNRPDPRWRLQSRQDRIQRRAMIANSKIRSLMAEFDKFREETKL